jgi:hypothetical protein
LREQGPLQKLLAASCVVCCSMHTRRNNIKEKGGLVAVSSGLPVVGFLKLLTFLIKIKPQTPRLQPSTQTNTNATHKQTQPSTTSSRLHVCTCVMGNVVMVMGASEAEAAAGSICLSAICQQNGSRQLQL